MIKPHVLFEVPKVHLNFKFTILALVAQNSKFYLTTILFTKDDHYIKSFMISAL